MTDTKQKKNSKLRHAEYYDMQATLDKLFQDSKARKPFTNLMELIDSDDNIKLAYRNIKRNNGSTTAGMDRKTILDIEKLSEDEYLRIMHAKFRWYQPKAVKRVEIPKPDGRMRPLGIPSIWDRLVQQCILQILEPICEAQFHERSNGFRPNRSAEHAIAQVNHLMYKVKLHYAVDVDIKGFFDNVNHTKLIQQMWAMGIRDKKLICIIRAMLKAPICMPDGTVVHPDKGTPQGGILSPLLSNIVLNELDWWVASQWENMPMHVLTWLKDRPRQLKRTSKLKEMYIVRYADDFKIFCRYRSTAEKTYIAVKQWLLERLRLETSDEKSKICNLRRQYSDFLGFKLRVIRKGNQYITRTHMSDKAKRRETEKLIKQVKCIARPENDIDEAKMICKYNAMVIGIHNYYSIASCVNLDCSQIAYQVNQVIKTRLKSRLKKQGSYESHNFVGKRYGDSQQMRFVHGQPLVPIGYVQHRIPHWKKRTVCKFTAEGRLEIHNNLGVNMHVLLELMRTPCAGRSIEYMDNRISLYAAQYGRCAITGQPLTTSEIHCHHKQPISLGGSDRYENLIIVHWRIHQLIHATQELTIRQVLSEFNLSEKQLSKLNKLREIAGLQQIA
ncbi:MAG: group II intron reverse transcriptase/maturase [Phocaeicola sp.]|nr:group II intron reverse transcriptase/maturase [Phocaeicola sp.]